MNGFDAHTGTRGSRQPGRVFKWLNKWILRRLRRNGAGKLMGMNVLVLTAVGRKSGEPRSTPVGWFPGGDDSWLIVASANGAAKSPAWYYNLAAHPDEVQVEIGHRKVDVVAEQLHGAERERAWQQITTAAPRFTEYQAKTDRELPIISLTPRAAD
ncbi:nitroreductase/quinone reductase family protein [Streptomyces sp. YKOK-I1]